MRRGRFSGSNQNLRRQRASQPDQGQTLRRDPLLRRGRAFVPAGQTGAPFFPFEAENFYYPVGRTPRYTIVEISMFEGRSVETQKNFIRLLFERAQRGFDLASADLEVTSAETPKHNWGFRGQPGDEVALNYKVEV